MAANANKAAMIAEDVAKHHGDTKHALWTKLTGQMCWEAVKYCGFLSDGRWFKGKFQGPSKLDVETLLASSPVVADADDLAAVPRGDILGFFRGNDAAHMMISLGEGIAAGTKNGCSIPHGLLQCALGGYWEAVDLNSLVWTNGAFADNDGRPTTIKHRSITCW